MTFAPDICNCSRGRLAPGVVDYITRVQGSVLAMTRPVTPASASSLNRKTPIDEIYKSPIEQIKSGVDIVEIE